MFAEIIIHDLRRPLTQRAGSRKYVGPYRWRPSQAGEHQGRGFYLARTTAKGDPIHVAATGSTFDLRLVRASEILPRRRGSTSYAIDEHDAFEGIVARLPRGRGFLAGATLGEGMASFIDFRIFDEIEDAAHDATETARIMAEREAEYREGMQAEEEGF